MIKERKKKMGIGMIYMAIIIILCACGSEDTRQEDVENTQAESEKVDDEASNTEIKQQTIDESAEEVGMPQDQVYLNILIQLAMYHVGF